MLNLFSLFYLSKPVYLLIVEAVVFTHHSFGRLRPSEQLQTPSDLRRQRDEATRSEVCGRLTFIQLGVNVKQKLAALATWFGHLIRCIRIPIFWSFVSPSAHKNKTPWFKYIRFEASHTDITVGSNIPNDPSPSSPSTSFFSADSKEADRAENQSSINPSVRLRLNN